MSISGVYLIHFDSPLAHARHYIGYASNITKRMFAHRSGQGSKLLRAVAARGISFSIVRFWQNADRTFERKLKTQGGAAQICPICSAERKRRKAEWLRCKRQKLATRNVHLRVLTSPKPRE